MKKLSRVALPLIVFILTRVALSRRNAVANTNKMRNKYCKLLLYIFHDILFVCLLFVIRFYYFDIFKNNSCRQRTDAGQFRFRFRCITGQMQDWTDAGQDGCRTGQMHDRTDAGQDGCRTGRMQDRTDAEKDGCRTCDYRTGRIKDRTDPCTDLPRVWWQ